MENPPHEEPFDGEGLSVERASDPMFGMLDLMRRQMEITLEINGHTATGKAAEWRADLAQFRAAMKALIG